MNYSSRRTVLVGSSTLAVGGLAGCLDDITGSEDSSGGNGNQVSRPSFQQWLFEPQAVGLGAYTYTYVDGDVIVNNHEYEVDSGTQFTAEATAPIDEIIVPMVDETGLEPIDGAVSIEYQEATGFAVTGGFEATELRSEYDEAVEEDDAAETDTYSGYDVYFDDEFAIGISDGAFVIGLVNTAAVSATGRTIAEAMIDARTGSATRLHAADETADRLPEEHGERTMVFGAPSVAETDVQFLKRRQTPSDEDDDQPAVTGGGFSVEVIDDELAARATVITDQPVSDVESFGNGLAIRDWFDDPDVTQDNGVLTYEGRTGDADRDEPTDGGPAESPPQISFDIDVEQDVVTVVHAAGDTVPAEELDIVIDGQQQRAFSWTEVGNTGTVTAGDAATIELEESDYGGRLFVVWHPGGATLAQRDIPDSPTEPTADISFDVEFDLHYGTISVTYTGSESVPASEYVLVIEGETQRNHLWEELSSTRTIEPDDTVTLDLESGDYGGVFFIWSTLHDEMVLEESIPRS